MAHKKKNQTMKKNNIRKEVYLIGLTINNYWCEVLRSPIQGLNILLFEYTPFCLINLHDYQRVSESIYLYHDIAQEKLVQW